MLADTAQTRTEVFDEPEHRLARVELVRGLVGEEPVATVVRLEFSQEREQTRREVSLGAHRAILVPFRVLRQRASSESKRYEFTKDTISDGEITDPEPKKRASVEGSI